jgi:hypothetical protein
MKHLLLALLAATLSAAPPKPVAGYAIQAKLDVQAHTITATETIDWLNDSPDTVPTLQFHLYMNAFKNTRSTFYRESGGQLRGDRFEGDQWGAVDIRRLRLDAGPDLTSAIRFIHPDDGNKDDQTVAEVALPQPVKPGQTLRIVVDFTTKLPMVFARTGFHKDFYMGGQWFPKLGVWETAGFRYSKQGAWNCHQFHANSEFYANYGDYKVDLTLPAGYVVGATGENTARKDNPDRTTTWSFEQKMVTDFAWTAQPTYIREERMFLAARETTPAEIAAAAKLHGIPESDASLSDVRMIAVIQPEHAEQTDRHFAALRAALKGFGLRYGRYPYKTITVVDPPFGAMGAAGMEYPTLITAGTNYRLPEEVHTLEEVTVHEFGHQFWMELVANNEFEESILDEGFNTYSTSKVMEEAYSPTMLQMRAFGLNFWKLLDLPTVKEDSMNRAASVARPVLDDLQRFSWQYYDSNSYGINSYMKTATTLRTLENILGRDVMARLMRVYHQRWRFSHPTVKAFQEVVNEVSGKNMDRFFDQFIFGNRTLDYAVGDVENREVSTPAGFFDEPGKRVTVTFKDADKKDEANEKRKDFKKQYESFVKIRRVGDAVLPVEILFRFEDGRTETRSWDGEYRWAKFTFSGPSEISEVTVDPARKHLLDTDYANNSWKKKYNKELSASWTANLLFWAQNLLLWMTAVA